MANSINHVTLLGNVGGVKTHPTVTRLRVATSRPTKDGDQWVEVTDWHDVVTFNKQAEYARDYVRVGDRVAVTGRLVVSSYEKDGRQVKTTEVHARDLVQLTKRDRSRQNRGADHRTPHDDIPF